MNHHFRLKSAGSAVLGLSTWGFGSLLAVCVIALLSAGCQSTPTPEIVPFASVEIHGHPVDRVRDVTAQVFNEHGYELMKRGWVDLVFEKEGSTMNNIAYGNWMGSGIWVRVRAKITDISPGESRINCEACLLRNRGEPTEEEIRINKLHRHPYQKLLNEVVKRLKIETPAVN